MKTMPAGAEIGFLPKAAQAKFEGFELRAEELYQVAQVAQERVRDEVHGIRDLQAALTHFAPSPNLVRNADGSMTRVDAPEVVRTKRLIEAARERRAIFEARAAEKGAQHQEQVRLNTTIREWLTGAQHLLIAPMPDVEVKTRKGENVADAVERVRRRVRELKADLVRAERAPIFAAEAKERARAYVEDIARLAKPDVFGLVEGRGDIRWPMLASASTNALMSPSGFILEVPGRIHDGLALTALLHRDALLAVLDREIDAVADDANALTDADRARLTAQAVRDILATEREEEGLIALAETEGREITRRGDVDPRAVLQVYTIDTHELAEAA